MMFWDRPAILPPATMPGILSRSTLLRITQTVINGSPNKVTATPYSAQIAAPSTKTPSSSFNLKGLSTANQTTTIRPIPMAKCPSLSRASVSVNRYTAAAHNVSNAETVRIGTTGLSRA